MNSNNYDTGVPPTNVHPKGSLATRIESHIPGTQAHREREYIEHQDQATFGRNHPVPPMGAVPGNTNNVGAQNTTGFGPTNTFAPPNQPPPPPRHPGAAGVGQGVGQGYDQGYDQGYNQGYGGAPPVGVDTGFGPGAAGATGGPTFHKHGNTMKERTAELHGRGNAGAGAGVGPGAATGVTGAVGNGTVPKKGPHIGDKITGGIEATIGRAINNTSMEQAGWERKTFGTEAAKQGGVHPSTTKQPY